MTYYIYENTGLRSARLHHGDQERRERLELAADAARDLLEDRRALLDSVEVIPAYAREMNEFLRTSEVTESKAFIRSFVKEIVVKPGTATIRYTTPTPPDSPNGGGDVAEFGLPGRVITTVSSGTPGRNRTCAHGLGNHCSIP